MAKTVAAAETANAYTPVDEDFVLVPASEKKEEAAEAVTGVRHETLKRFFAQKSAVAGVVILGILILLSLIGPHISGHSYDEQNLEQANMAPRAPGISAIGILDGSENVPKTSGTVSENKYEEQGLDDTYYFFGTDNLGRDLFARCFMGLRISMVIALIATLINLIIGMNYGVISGYFGGMTDILMQRVIDVIGSIPTLVVVTLLMLILEPGMGSIILALMPTTFITGLQYVLAAMLVLGAINQFVNLAQASRWCHVGWFYWLLPVEVLLVAIFMIWRPIEVAAAPLFIIGWCMLLYGMAELLGGLMLWKARRTVRQMERAALEQEEAQRAITVADAEVVEEG